jgi:hypothetical protein
MTKSRSTKHQIVLCLAAVLALQACGAKDDDKQAKDDPTTPSVAGGGGGASSDGTLPDVRSIDLAAAESGGAALALADGAEGCGRFARYGAFGLPLGLACGVGPIVETVLYGKAALAQAHPSCAGYDPQGSDEGILRGLLCNDDVRRLTRLQSARIDDGKHELALRFEDFDATDDIAALGSWTAAGGAAGVFPAAIRGYTGPSGGALAPVFGLALASAARGRVLLDLAPIDVHARGAVDFDATQDASSCKSAPSREHCHWQEVTLVGDEAAAPSALVPGTRLTLLADDRRRPTIVIVEASVRLTADWAARTFADPTLPTSFKDTRTLYMRAVVTSDVLWGSFVFRDAQGAEIAAVKDGVDLGRWLRDGVGAADSTAARGAGLCMSPVTAAVRACTGFELATYAPLFRGEERMTPPAAGYALPVDLGTAPVAGIVLAP